MISLSQIKSIEQHIKGQAPERIQSAIAQVFRDIGSQKITPKAGLNEIERIKSEARK